MQRVFSPEDDIFRWDDLSRAPKVGELFFELADSLADEPVSRQLDAAVLKKNQHGVLIETPLPPSFSPNPIAILGKLAAIKSYRANVKQSSRTNIVTVSRISAAALEDIHRRIAPGSITPDQAEGVRNLLSLVHRKMDGGFVGLVDANHSDEYARTLDIYSKAGQLIIGHWSNT